MQTPIEPSELWPVLAGFDADSREALFAHADRIAEAVSRHYISSSRCECWSWAVGDVAKTPGRGLFVRPHVPEASRGGAWSLTDVATDQHL